MNKNEYFQYAFKKVSNQDAEVSTYVAQNQFRIEGDLLGKNGIFILPWE